MNAKQRNAEAEETRRLLLATAGGDRAAFAQLYALSSPRLFGLVLRIVRRRDLAEDVLQEAYLRIWDHAADYRPERGAAAAWMGRIARNRALDWYRKQNRDPVRGTPEIGPENSAGPELAWDQVDDEGRQLKDCLEELEVRQRDCILLAFVEGYTHQELALRLERPLGTVKSLIRRGLARLKSCIEA